MLDWVNSDEFGLIAMTNAINLQPYRPTKVQQLGLFEEAGVDHWIITIERRHGKLRVLPIQEPTGKKNALQEIPDDLIPFHIRHVNENEFLYPAQFQSRRQFGTSEATIDVQGEINRKQLALAQNLQHTLEYHRITMLDTGQVKDADGTVVLDLFAEFEVTPEPEIAFDLANTDHATLIDNIDTMLMTMSENLLNVELEECIAFAGKNFWSAFVAHAGVRDDYQRWRAQGDLLAGSADGQMGDFLRTNYFRRGFSYRNVTWHYYQNPTDQQFIDPDKVLFFPPPMSELYLTKWAPSQRRFETINTIGLPMYSWINDPSPEWSELYAEMNDLNIMTQPKALMKGRVGA